jgi:hypothetical protein
LSVPKILTPFIPEILARPAMAGRTRNLSVPRLVRRAGQREEDVRNAKTTRSRNLVKAGHRKTEVAGLTGVSLRSVKRIAEESPVVHVDDVAERGKRRIGRPSMVETFRKLVLEILEEKPELASLEILRRVRQAGYGGGKTVLYALVASVRPKPGKPLVRFEGLPGEFSQHDFGEVETEFLERLTLINFLLFVAGAFLGTFALELLYGLMSFVMS